MSSFLTKRIRRHTSYPTITGSIPIYDTLLLLSASSLIGQCQLSVGVIAAHGGMASCLWQNINQPAQLILLRLRSFDVCKNIKY